MEGALNFFSILAGIGALAAGFGFAYAQFKSGGSKAKDDLVNTYREQLQLEQEKTKNLRLEIERLNKEKETLVQSHQGQLTSLTQKVGKLEGLVEAGERKLKEYTDILQGRSPEQVAFQNTVLEAVKKSNEVTPAAKEYMKQTTEILVEIRDFMKSINENRQSRPKRDRVKNNNEIP